MSEYAATEAAADTVPASEVESPLHYFLGRESGSGAGLVVREAALKGHLNLRGDPVDPGFVQGVESVLGLALPIEPCTWKSNGATSIYWLSPNEWLLIIEGNAQTEVEQRLREALAGHIAIVDVSGGQTLINISGAGVETVLKKSSGYDFHPHHFGPGRCVQTTFAKATALVIKREDASFDLVIRRSFADYLASWLLDAGREFGCRIEQGE